MDFNCKKCGHQIKVSIEKTTMKKMGLAVIATRCGSCKLWATYEYDVMIEGKQYSRKVKDWEKRNGKTIKEY